MHTHTHTHTYTHTQTYMHTHTHKHTHTCTHTHTHTHAHTELNTHEQRDTPYTNSNNYLRSQSLWVRDVASIAKVIRLTLEVIQIVNLVCKTSKEVLKESAETTV